MFHNTPLHADSQAHERALLATLREEVERQKAMRMSAMGKSQADLEVEIEGLRQQAARADAGWQRQLSEMNRAWQLERQQLEAAHAAQLREVRETEAGLRETLREEAADAEQLLRNRLQQAFTEPAGAYERDKAAERAAEHKALLAAQKVSGQQLAAARAEGAAPVERLRRQLVTTTTDLSEEMRTLLAHEAPIAPKQIDEMDATDAARALRGLVSSVLEGARRTADEMATQAHTCCVTCRSMPYTHLP